MKRIVLLASGSGSNVENIANFFKDDPKVTIATVFTNKRDAKVIDRCNRLEISVLYFNKQSFSKSDCLLDILKSINPDLIVLAGFLLKIPESFVHSFPNKIINIHPALLPKYGGKGMYGMNVHNAVKNNKEVETGITIHYVTKNYDEGAVIFQAKTAVADTDSPEAIAEKVHGLEYEHFPKVIQQLLSN
ncbi:phosphoribosylglycinamide formyltransferase [Cellulophaga sp. F20128]|uniref:phosphoribosylglycinamide formyltransferase n=1 Tax=Cellulophaga sp. F20128 TaxID=2926413 RepID=UPI001FF33B1E|nr:phosphoribosylglycinamide formyltransferase [Cellulophaga sp. F20128]MCK0158577.1 phosphoribosylglycinamide formyltransferase [Cellulophaga sp. F20128]